MFKNYRIRDYDFKLIIMLIAVSVLGVMTIGSAREIYKEKQMMGLVLGIIVMLVLSFLDYSYILNFYWVLYVINIALLALVQFMGDTSGGAQRWLDLGFMRFQPSETAKHQCGSKPALNMVKVPYFHFSNSEFIMSLPYE